jgi:stringent starvation protein B
MSRMTSSRPYLIRALYEWITDNGLTPYLLADASHPDVQAPTDLADPGGRLVLNISPRAVRDLDLGQGVIGFGARFAGTAWQVSIPVPAVVAIYARENGHGMVFSDDDHPRPPDDGEPGSAAGVGGRSSPGVATPRRPNLRVVK